MSNDNVEIKAVSDVPKVYRGYVEEVRKAARKSPKSPTIEELDHEYDRLDKRWRLVRAQFEKSFDEEEQPVSSHIPGLCVELKLAAEQSVYAYALLSSLARRQDADDLVEGGAYPLINASPLQAIDLLNEMDEAQQEKPPYCYAVTAVFGSQSRQATCAHAKCRRVFRRRNTLLAQGWRRYQVWGPILANQAKQGPIRRWLIKWLLAQAIVGAVSENRPMAFLCRVYLAGLSVLAKWATPWLRWLRRKSRSSQPP